ncbi:MAG TPA: STAS domain-containing protein [Capillimicrobium sp.]
MSVKRSGEGQERQTVAVTGDLELATALKLELELDAAIDDGAREIVVDLAGTTLMDSTGLAAIVEGQRRLAQRGGRLTVANPVRAVRQVIEFSGLDDVLLASA